MLQRLLSSVAVHDLIMNPEMNNNDRKTHSKTIAMAGIGFLLIATAFTIPFASSGTRLASAQQGGNATTTIVATPFDTFTGSGAITATIQEQGGGGGGNQSASRLAAGGNQSAAAGGAATNQQQAGGGGNQSAAAAAATNQQTTTAADHQQAEVQRLHTS